MAMIAWAAAGCATQRAPGAAGRVLAPGALPPGPSVGLGTRTDVIRGALAYAVAFAGDHALVTVALTDSFALLVHDLPPRGAPRLRHRIPLGPADFDVGDLAVDTARDQAWVASRAGTVRGYDLRRGALITTWHLGSGATAVAVSPDGRFVATGTADGILCLRRRDDGALLQCVAAHDGPIAGLDFGADRGADRASGARDPLLASCAWDGTVVVWRVPSLAIRAHRAFVGSANAVAFAPAGDRLAVARSQAPPRRSPAVLARERAGGPAPPSPADAVTIWTMASGATTTLTGHGGPVTAVAWTPRGARLASGSWDRSVRLWNPGTGTLVARSRGFAGLVRDLAMAPRGGRLAAGAWTDIEGLEGPTSAIIDLLFLPPRPPSPSQSLRPRRDGH